jgi:hypothetical protein
MWEKEIKAELIMVGGPSLRHALTAYVTHDHEERPHQGTGNVV